MRVFFDLFLLMVDLVALAALDALSLPVTHANQ